MALPGLFLDNAGGSFAPAGSSSATSDGRFDVRSDLAKTFNFGPAMTTTQVALIVAGVLAGLWIWKRL